MAITLKAGITATDTQLLVLDADYATRRFPLVVQAGTEIMLVTGGARHASEFGTTYAIHAVRGYDGSTAATHAADDTLTPVVPLVGTAVTAAPLAPAANVAAIAVPGTATASDAATKINAVLTALKAAGLMAADA